MPGRDAVERIVVQPQQAAVPHSVDMRCAHPGSEEGHLADRLAGGHLAEHLLRTVARGDRGAQPAVNQQVHPVGGVPLREEPEAALEVDPITGSFDLTNIFQGDPPDQRHQRLAEGVKIGSVVRTRQREGQVFRQFLHGRQSNVVHRPEFLSFQ